MGFDVVDSASEGELVLVVLPDSSAGSGGYRREPTPFFNRIETVQQIRALASAPTLTIYVGAGATIDQGGLSWGQLIKRVAMSDVIRGKEIVSDTDVLMLAKVLNPLEAATAILAHFHTAKGTSQREEAYNALVQCLSYNLYPANRWDAGELARAIGSVAIIRSVNNMRTQILTTNYDTLLESTLRHQVESYTQDRRKYKLKGPGPKLKVSTLEKGLRGSATDRIDFVYLHGRIPPSPRDGVEGHIAFTEIDYAKVRPAVSELLRVTFSSSSLLIVGASLTDPPLISALQDTASLSDNDRLAILPVPAIQQQARLSLSAVETTSLRAQHAARMSTLNVTLLTPDFYSSVAQFCDEVECATYRYLWGPGRPRSVVSPYWERLTRWWDQWYEHRFRNSQFRHAFDIYVNLFVQELSNDILEATDNTEQLKVELWAIWDPSEQQRTVRLWASTAWPRSKWDRPDVDYLEATARTAEITRQSAYPAVRAIIEGRPGLSDAATSATATPDDNPHVSRWRTFLSVPISVTVEHGRIAVGAVTLASTQSSSYLSERSPALLEKCVRRMRDVGQVAFGLESKKISAFNVR